MSEVVRLSKRVVELLGCSRREAELYIENGGVSVDGEIIDAPFYKVRPQQQVALIENASAQRIARSTVILNAPANYPELDEDESAEWLEHWQQADGEAPLVYKQRANLLMGPELAEGCSGLLVLTQVELLLPKLARVEQEYVLHVTGEASAGRLAQLQNADFCAKHNLPKGRASWQSEGRLRYVMKGDQLLNAHKLCAAVGLAFTEGRRLRLGGVSLSRLPLGQWRMTKESERF